MKLVFFVLTLLFSSVTLAERNIEVLPDSIGENPHASSHADSINQRLSALKNKINGHQHQLKLKTKALHTARKNSAKTKIKSESKGSRAKLRRIIGTTTTN